MLLLRDARVEDPEGFEVDDVEHRQTVVQLRHVDGREAAPHAHGRVLRQRRRRDVDDVLRADEHAALVVARLLQAVLDDVVAQVLPAHVVHDHPAAGRRRLVRRFVLRRQRLDAVRVRDGVRQRQEVLVHGGQLVQRLGRLLLALRLNLRLERVEQARQRVAAHLVGHQRRVRRDAHAAAAQVAHDRLPRRVQVDGLAEDVDGGALVDAVVCDVRYDGGLARARLGQQRHRARVQVRDDLAAQHRLRLRLVLLLGHRVDPERVVALVLARLAPRERLPVALQLGLAPPIVIRRVLVPLVIETNVMVRHRVPRLLSAPER